MLVYTYLKILFLIVSHFATPTNDFTLLKRDTIFFPTVSLPVSKVAPFTLTVSLSFPPLSR